MQLESLLDRIRAARTTPAAPSATPKSESWQPVQPVTPRTQPAPACPACRDMGWVIPDLPRTHPRFGQAVPCPCRSAQIGQARAARLQRIDGLSESQRAMTFAGLTITDANQLAVRSVRDAARAGRGLITLTGDPGAGKTTLLACAVNALRDSGVAAVYTTATDLLDFLRNAFDPNRSRDEDDAGSFDDRWRLLTTAACLAVDELDEFSPTAWARERFLRLVDERWQHIDDRLTLFAANTLATLEPKVRSRLGDGRALLLHLDEADWRPLND